MYVGGLLTHTRHNAVISLFHSSACLFKCNLCCVFFSVQCQNGLKVERCCRLTLTMAVMHHPGYPLRDSLYWDETECLNYYGMLSLHEVFEIVGSQLTETDIEVLSFLLNETCPAQHPLDPAGWTVKPCEGKAVDSGVSLSPQLLKAWRRLQPQGSQHPLVASYKPKSGLELLLELERRGYLSDGNMEPLLQLLRVLTRHDLLPLVSHKKRRTGEVKSHEC